MEKQLSNLSCLTEYHHRQVVLNYFQDEDFLWKRDGFHFESVKLFEENLLFVKKDGHIVVINLGDYEEVAVHTDFPHYYICRTGSDRLELYFPN